MTATAMPGLVLVLARVVAAGMLEKGAVSMGIGMGMMWRWQSACLPASGRARRMQGGDSELGLSDCLQCSWGKGRGMRAAWR